VTQELAVTREELARATAVAARVAASEHKAGLKVEGTISMAQHGAGCRVWLGLRATGLGLGLQV